MANVLEMIEKKESRTDHANFHVGDTIKVYFRIKEGDKERVQIFEGVCIAKGGTGIRKTVTVRKVSFSQGVERIFPLSSPRVEKIEVVQSGHVRRAKLYYLRDLRGKKARIKERQDYSRVLGIQATATESETTTEG